MRERESNDCQMQALPFMLIGVFVSSAMHLFLSDEFLVRIFPTKHGIGFLVAMLGGILFPICECAIVPVTTRLVKKGVAQPIALVFMFSAPIINPIVIISTLFAFPGRPEIALMRVCFGLTISLVLGLIILGFGIKNPLLLWEQEFSYGCRCCHEDHSENKPVIFKVRALFLHAGEEFFDVGKYLILGAFLTSIARSFMDRFSIGSKADAWVIVSGTIDKTDFNGEAIPYIRVVSIQDTEKPNKDYIYPY